MTVGCFVEVGLWEMDSFMWIALGLTVEMEEKL